MRFAPLQNYLLMTLCWRGRCATEGQLAKAARCSLEEVQSAVRWLKKERLVSRRRQAVIAYRLTGPLATSEQTTGRENFSHIAWLLEKRWAQAPRRVATVVWATRRAVELVGGICGRLRQPLQLQHDLGVSEVYAIWQRKAIGSASEANETWVGEDAYHTYWQRAASSKVPDAVLIGSDGQIKRVIEFGGRYSKERLRSFVRYWKKQHTAYEIW